MIRKVKNEIKNNFKKLKKDSTLSYTRIIATALTAITMAYISSRLTSFINSLILVSIISIGTAVLSEVYRICFGVVAESTKKIIPIKSNRNIISNFDKEENKRINSEKKTIDTKETNFYKHRFLMLSVIFALVSLLTIGSSYLFAKAFGNEESINYYNVSRISKISEQDKNNLTNEIIEELETPSPEIAETQIKTNNNSTEIENLKKELEETSKENENLKNKLETLQSNLEVNADSNIDTDILDIIKGLETNIKSLDEKLGKLEKDFIDLKNNYNIQNNEPNTDSNILE